ncbi:MAG: rod-binding protein [Spirochaetota bacterium]
MDSITSALGQAQAIDEGRFQKGTAVLKDLEKTASAKSFESELESVHETDEKKLSARDAHRKKQEAKLWDACIQTESLFVNQMLKEMRKTVHKGDILNGGQTEEIFQDMLYDEYAVSISKTSNLGIAKSMYDQMSKIL